MPPDEPVSPSVRPTYFHCLPALLAPGSIIEPGNWGRMVRAYRLNPQQGISPIAFRETIFEAVRKRVAPTKPSRMACVFACRSEEDIRAFMANDRPFDVVYEIETVGEPALHIGPHDLPLLQVPPGEQYFDSFESRAETYWTATPPPQRSEVLIGGPVRVLRRL